MTDWTFDEERADGELLVRATDTESDDETGGDDETVTFTADWRASHRAILDATLPDDIDIADTASVPRTAAETAIADAKNVSARTADAVLASLTDNGVTAQSASRVTVLWPTDADRPNQDDRWTNAYAALADTLRDLSERLDAAMAAQRETPDFEEKKREVAVELRALGPGDDVTHPDDLTDAEREQYEELKRRFVHLDNLDNARIDGVTVATTGLASRADALDETTTYPADAMKQFATATTAAADTAAALDADRLDHRRFAECIEPLRDAVSALTGEDEET